MYKLIFVAVVLYGAGLAYSQTTDGRADPADPKAGVPPSHYRSAFADYETYRDPQVANWRDVNEAVRSAGGHVGLAAKPAAGAKGAAPNKGVEPAEATPKSAPGGHAGHH